MVTMMWASLDMVTLDSLQVFKDQSLIQIWSAILFTLYHAASLIVLLNMLIAMMSNSYQRVEVFKLLLVTELNNIKGMRSTTWAQGCEICEGDKKLAFKTETFCCGRRHFPISIAF